MSSLEDFRLTGAGQTYAVSNTPYFLVRKLREDPEVCAIAEECSSENILEALRSAVSQEPKSLTEVVRPYALLVALWFKPRIEDLQEAARLHTPFLDWYAYVAEWLLKTFSSVQGQDIEFPGLLPGASVSIGLEDATSQIELAGQ